MAVLGVLVCLAAAVLAVVNSDDEPDGGYTPTAVRPEKAPAAVTRQLSRAERCAGFEARSERRSRIVTGDGERVVVIGDSWAVGRDVPMRKTWPVFLPGEIHVHAFPGSALSDRDVNRCGGVSFADRAPAALADGADLVVVEGGLNDVKRTEREVRAGFARLMDELSGHDVILLGPPSTPKRAAGVVRVDRLLAQLAADAGVTYVPTLDLPVTFLPDRLHPDLAGHRAYGTAVAQRLADLGLI